MEIEQYLKSDYIKNIVSQGKRADNRQFDEYRPVTVQKGYVKDKAEGSAMIHMGDTKVLAGVKMDIGEPYPDNPESGVMTTNAELRPMASPYFESGPPGQESIELARVVDRGIRESKAIDLEKLFLEKEKVWMVFIDIHVLDDCGNLIDASALAAMAALLDARIPKYEDGCVVRGEWSKKLPVTKTPITCTIGKIGEQLVSDPTTEEEYAITTRLSIATTDMINAMQKGGSGALTKKEIDEAIERAFRNGAILRKTIE